MHFVQMHLTCSDVAAVAGPQNATVVQGVNTLATCMFFLSCCVRLLTLYT